jgi:hypothetical protein
LHTVGYATTNDPTMNECYNEQFLSIKLGCYNEQRCYNERGGIPFILESSIIVFTKKRLLMLFVCVRLFTKERLFMLFKFTCTLYRS